VLKNFLADVAGDCNRFSGKLWRRGIGAHGAEGIGQRNRGQGSGIREQRSGMKNCLCCFIGRKRSGPMFSGKTVQDLIRYTAFSIG